MISRPVSRSMSAKWTPLFLPPIQNETSRPSMRTVGLSTTPVGPASGLLEYDSSVERNHVPLLRTAMELRGFPHGEVK